MTEKFGLKSVVYTVFNCALILIGSILVACVLLIAVGLLCSSEKMRCNLQKDTPYFLSQGDLNYVLGEEYLSFAGDFPSDVLMVKTCIYDNDEQSFLNRVFGDYHYLFEDYETDSDKNLLLDLNRGWLDEGVEVPSYVFHYGRYWHGYQVVLKPMLCMFSWREIVIIGFFIQLMIFILTIVLIYKNHGAMWIVPIVVLYFLLNPISIAVSFQYQSLYYITFGCLIFIESKVGRMMLNSKSYVYFFLLIGILTSFFDFLTYPIVPIGICLCWMVTNSDGNLMKNVKKVIAGGLSWGCGYGLFWASKWLITTLVTSENIFSNAGKSFSGYISKEGNSVLSVIAENYEVLLKKPYVLLLILTFGAVIYWSLRNISDIKNFVSFLPCLLLGALPIVWYIFASRHSYLHSYMTHRDSIVTYFAVMAYFLSVSNGIEKQQIAKSEDKASL